MELQHFSHEEHPLILGEVNDDGGEAIVCKGCCQNIAGSAYSCQNCLFFWHKLCAELPEEMIHPMHSKHPLTLQPLSSHVCNVCGERVHGFGYRCSPCDFDVDIRCSVRGQHFSHKHQLILLHQNEEKKNDDGERVSCYGCLQPITGSVAAYRCTNWICSIHLHKLCAELPAEMQHQMHPQHPLTLLAVVPYEFRCDSCDAYSKALFTYRCTLCNFNLDISCALRAQSVKHESHNHPLSLMPSLASFECHACRTKREDISYMCNTCNFWIHESCASLPTTFKHSNHVHPLTLRYSFPKILSQLWGNCYVCDETILRGSSCWFYACDGCLYYIHVNCSSKTKERKIAIKVEDIDEANLIHLPVSDDQSVNLIDQFVKQISLRDIKREVKDNYFSHDHPLILFDAQGDNDLCSKNELIILNEQKNKKICNACARQISVPFYSCSLCDFFLHKWCAELPNELEHPCHEHQLNLVKKCPKNRGFFECNGCQNFCNGFAFKCDYCEDYYLDVNCACLPSFIIHKTHECSLPLFLRTNCIAEGCAACPRRIVMFSFGCDTCNFNLHYTCALLPHTIKHRYDKHPFTLIYTPIEDASEEYICEFCEEEIDPKWWFYHCIHCDQSACVKCIYKEENKYPTIKRGITYDSEPHPLVLVESTDPNACCDNCHESLHKIKFVEGYYKILYRIVFKCEQCGIMLHPWCPHPHINSSSVLRRCDVSC